MKLKEQLSVLSKRAWINIRDEHNKDVYLGKVEHVKGDLLESKITYLYAAPSDFSYDYVIIINTSKRRK